jgi:solute carrier family 13 (sodium-dependent dicarboxylate transporter), member 2/3/5
MKTRTSATAPSPPPVAPPPAARSQTRARVGLLLGPVCFVALLLLAPPEALSEEAWRTAAVGVLMAIWWVTEAVPIPATALLPLVLFPLIGVMPIGDAAPPYANPVIFLFMGGFMLALALEKSGLHRRIALAIVGGVGARPANLVAGFMVATALLSMWVSNTAAVVMMLPVATSIIVLVGARGGRTGAHNFPVALLLGIAYGASIGGVGTLIGTPPNALLAGFMAEVYGVRIGFAEWMLFGVPLVIVALPLTWAYLTRLVFPVPRAAVEGGDELIRRERETLGALSRGEARVAIVAAAMALAWMTQPLLVRVVPAMTDAGIAITGALVLFVTPVDWRRGEFALDWKQTERLPWGILVLFGGGLSLAAAIQTTGLAAWIGEQLLGLQALPLVLVTVLVTSVVVFLTELTSNTATAAAFLPIVAAAAVAFGVDPLVLAVPAVVGASCAFMLPVATPPNALVYATGEVDMTDMIRAGFGLNVMMIALLNVFVFAFGEWLLPGQ